MLVSMKEILDHARDGMYAVPAPNCYSELCVRAALEAAEETNSPMIIDVGFNQSADLVFTGGYMARLADKARIPVALNLDHGGPNGSKDTIVEIVTAIRAGFTSVMCDRSSYSYEENVRMVKEVVHIAHQVDVSVEAEIGHCGAGNRYTKERDAFLTDPDVAKRFVEETNVDCIAVAVGNAHGSYFTQTPYLDFDRIAELREKVPVPLVVHGSSGTGDDNLRKACSMGINKVNVLGDLLKSAWEELQNADLENNGIYEMYPTIYTGWKKRLLEYIDITGCAGKAWDVPRGLGDRKFIRPEEPKMFSNVEEK